MVSAWMTMGCPGAMPMALPYGLELEPVKLSGYCVIGPGRGRANCPFCCTTKGCPAKPPVKLSGSWASKRVPTGALV